MKIEKENDLLVEKGRKSIGRGLEEERG